MATLDYSRAATDKIIIEVDSKWDAVIDVTRDDSGSVDFTDKTIKMDIMTKHGQTPVVTLTSGTDITISTNRLTFSKTFTELSRRGYVYELYNDTDDISISKGELLAI